MPDPVPSRPAERGESFALVVTAEGHQPVLTIKTDGTIWVDPARADEAARQMVKLYQDILAAGYAKPSLAAAGLRKDEDGDSVTHDKNCSGPIEQNRAEIAKPSLPPDGGRFCQVCGERRSDVMPRCATCRELAMRANAALFAAAPKAERR